MKTQLIFFTCLITSILIYSCVQYAQNENQDIAQETFQYNGQAFTLKKNVPSNSNDNTITSNTKKVVFKELLDNQRNMLMAHVPVPEDWVIHTMVGEDEILVSAPKDIKIYAPRSDFFTYSELPDMNQLMAQKGYEIRPLMNVEDVVKTVLEPVMNQQGTSILNQYHLPELQKFAEDFDQFTFKSVPMRKEFRAYATEWRSDKNSKRFLSIINYSVSYTQTGVFWGYDINIMEAPENSFEKAKENYVYALVNMKYNPRWLQTCYLEEAQKASRFNEIHQQRMASLRAEGEAIIQRGREHSAMVDANHKRWLDTHLERTNVSSPSGQTYQVDTGSKEYWMNSNNEYIKSDDLFYDPNTDNSVNTESWTKMTINK